MKILDCKFLSRPPEKRSLTTVLPLIKNIENEIFINIDIYKYKIDSVKFTFKHYFNVEIIIHCICVAVESMSVEAVIELIISIVEGTNRTRRTQDDEFCKEPKFRKCRQ